MSRLTELIDYYAWKVNELAKGYEIATKYMEMREIKEYNAGCQRVDDTLEALKELQHYKDLEEQGRLIELPCKVGDSIYFVTEGGEVLDVRMNNVKIILDFKDSIGKGFYLTKEEAEAKLKELKGGKE